ncbi:hypothetical protein [Actinoplanes couchii]|uniref:hypothetical protein n=1 Tax=Actinoplanes couchii TaxID=403638 RepID=UPI001941B507|nr:hypothetical protein [Actinoplanes couchii]MDR6321374.1 hypothetical protein [Actinoplanes couchii]
MHSRARIWWAVAGAVAVSLVVVGVLLGASAEVRGRADEMGSVLSALAALVGLPLSLLAVSALTDRGGGGAAAAVDDPLEVPARQLARYWTREADRRELRKAAMTIRWRVTGRPVGVPADEVAGQGAGRATRLRLRGEVAGLAQTWRRLPYRRMVLIGGPGSGKTSAAVLFMCALLEDRVAGDPVPVLLDLSGWRASEERFDGWLGRILAGQHGLRATARQARRLVEDGRVVAVLDGFDEMPVEERAAAVTALNELLDLPFVVLGRAREFEETVAATGEPLMRALIVELDPLSARQTARYLPSGQPESGRWSVVQRHLEEHPGGALAGVLSNPLLAYLARTVYRKPATDPAEMIALAAGGFLERHLFEAYLPALYPGDGRSARWLGSLARLLERQGSADFAWWRIGWAHGRRVPAARLAFAVAVAVPWAVLFLPFTGVRFWVFQGLVLAMAVAAFRTDVDAAPVVPRQVRFQVRSFVTSVVAGPALFVPLVLPMLVPLLGGVVVTVLTLVLTGAAVWGSRTFVTGTARGVYLLARAGRRWREVEVPPVPPPNKPALAFLVSTAVLMLGSPDVMEDLRGRPPLLIAGVALVVVTVFGLPPGLLVGLGTAFARAAPADDLWDPQRSLRSDRLALVVPPLLVGALSAALPVVDAALGTGLFPDDVPPWVYPVALGLIGTVAVTSMVIFFAGSAWFTYVVVRAWLAVRGRLPWGLMPFLAEAARRGVLRRNGAVYQFRHERLREHLAGT